MALTGIQSAAAGDRITVTKNPKMHRIMRHEFHNGIYFDPVPLHNYLASLTREQVRLLMTYPKQKYENKHRLVVFITLDPSVNSLMCADKCDAASTPIHSNSHFAVFHCNGVASRVELVCYTKEFNLFAHRPPLEARNTAEPKVYKVSAMNMSHVPEGEGDVIWHRISKIGNNDVGTAIYGGDAHHAPNSLHGMINTMGCWMLFRNYNWYKPKQAEFFEAYQDYRKGRNFDETLVQLGYNEIDDGLRVTRFLSWERNYAYTWFTRDIVGIDYFSIDPNINEFNVNDSVQPATFPPVPTPTSYNAHDWNARHHDDAHFAMTKALWTTNELGFQTADDFATFTGSQTYKLESKSWADVYVYTS